MRPVFFPLFIHLLNSLHSNYYWSRSCVLVLFFFFPYLFRFTSPTSSPLCESTPLWLKKSYQTRFVLCVSVLHALRGKLDLLFHLIIEHSFLHSTCLPTGFHFHSIILCMYLHSEHITFVARRIDWTIVWQFSGHGTGQSHETSIIARVVGQRTEQLVEPLFDVRSNGVVVVDRTGFSANNNNNR